VTANTAKQRAAQTLVRNPSAAPIAPVQLYDAYAPTLNQTSGSFGALTAEERQSIRTRLLHAVTARDGETLATLGSRTGNTWSTAQTAAANALPVETRLTARQLLKVVVERPYQAPHANVDS
jgi:predicted Zn-dependent protease